MHGSPMTAHALDTDAFVGEVDGVPVGLVTITGGAGLSLSICTYGARWLQALVPDAEGVVRDVVLGYDSLQGVRDGVPSMGAFIGRYACRIGGAAFPLSGRSWRLSANDGANCLHGGAGGSRHQVFQVVDQGTDFVTMAHRFRSAVDGFPGDLLLHVTYAIEGNNKVCIRYRAEALDRDTVGSFTSHAFFNLDGCSSGTVQAHALQVNAPAWLPLDKDKLPTGSVLPVGDTPFDLRTSAALDSHSVWDGSQGQFGFDHAWVWPDPPAEITGLRLQATLVGAQSGIAMDVWSTSPCLVVYTGGALDGTLPKHAGKAGRAMGRYAGICLEPQAYPDAPNHPSFPSTLIPKGTVHSGEIQYHFRIAT